jgi:hypothetical protein
MVEYIVIQCYAGANKTSHDSINEVKSTIDDSGGRAMTPKPSCANGEGPERRGGKA